MSSRFINSIKSSKNIITPSIQQYLHLTEHTKLSNRYTIISQPELNSYSYNNYYVTKKIITINNPYLINEYITPFII